MITAKRLLDKEVAEIIQANPFWFIENPPIVLKSYKDGRKRLVTVIQDRKYYIRQNLKTGKDEWYEVLNGSKT